MIRDCERRMTDEDNKDNKMKKEKEEVESYRRKENEDAQLAEGFERIDFRPEFALEVDMEVGNDDGG